MRIPLILTAVFLIGADQPGNVLRVGAERNDPRDVQAAVDALAQRGGGTVHVAPGRYLLREALQLRSGVRIVGVRDKTIFVLGPGRKTSLAKDVAKGATQITLADATGFAVGDGIALEDRAGHGFEVTTATLVERLGDNRFRLSRPAESDYLLARNGAVKRTFSGVGGWNVKDAALEGLTIEGTHGQPGSEYLGGCRGGGIYLYGCENVTVRHCVVRKYDGDAISFQGKCRALTIEDCLCEENANVGLHPGSGSHSCVVRKNVLRKNGYVGLFVCVGVRKVLFEENAIHDNAGCGISIGFQDIDNVFRGNRITNNAETGILFRCDSAKAEDGAHRNVFEQNVVRDNLGPRPAKSNSRPASAGQACVVIEGAHHELVFRANEFGFAQPHPGSAILHDSAATKLQLSENRLHNLTELSRERHDAAPGKDLRLSYVSAIDRTEQPYRLYVPTRHDGKRPLPLVFALHGTGGDENTLFDEPRFGAGALQRAAEKHGVLLVSPLGRGTTEYRGIGENDIFCVLEDVRKRYPVDANRIYLTGHSMGGTGAAYLALHHPDLFAAAAPLAAAYSFPWIARNAQRLPFLWVGGAEDAEFYHRGVAVGVERMRQFGAPVKLELLPGEGHAGPIKDFDRVLAWLLKHRCDPHPRSYFFELDTPLHGRAWWTAVEKIAEPGKMASIQGEAPGGNAARFTVRNVAAFTFAPDPQVFDLTRPIPVTINGVAASAEPIPAGQELHLTGGPERWKAALRKRRDHALTAYRTHPVAEAPEALDMVGTEKRLANWITDAMRRATGADIALYNAVYFRGLPIPKGTVDVVDLIQCSRPFDQYLVTVELTGRDLLDILDANVPHPTKDRAMKIDQPGAGRLLQLSGARYVFDPSKPDGQKIVESDLRPERTYTVVMEGQAVERETVLLAGRFRKLEYRTTVVPFTLALYGYAATTGKLEARREGRVRQVGQ